VKLVTTPRAKGVDFIHGLEPKSFHQAVLFVSTDLLYEILFSIFIQTLSKFLSIKAKKNPNHTLILNKSWLCVTELFTLFRLSPKNVKS